MNINEIISTFDNHISIKKIKEYFPDASNNNFEFTEVSQDEAKKDVLHLNVKKYQQEALFQQNSEAI